MRNIYEQAEVPAYVSHFIPSMAPAYRAADLALCRAGASTLSELLFFELPSILIPYPYATDDHQKKNADLLAKKIEGGVSFLEEEFASNVFLETLQSLLTDCERRKKMKKAIALYKLEEDKQELSSLVQTLMEKL